MVWHNDILIICSTVEREVKIGGYLRGIGQCSSPNL